MCGCCWQRAAAGNHCTYSFLDLAEFFELLAKRAFFGVPCQASNKELRHVGWNAEWDGLENANQSYAVTAGSQAGRVVQMVEI
jgi:hypothetical protein